MISNQKGAGGMESILSLLLNNQIYLLLLAIIMVLSWLAKTYNVFVPVYAWVAKHVKSKRLIVVIISFLTGILPISGRVAVSAGFLDTLAPPPTTEENKKKREPFGIIDYLSTHLFYFWSPLEKTILVPMAVLGVSYFALMAMLWPLLATGVIVVLVYIFGYLKEDDIEINIDGAKAPKPTREETIAQFRVYVKTLIWVFFVIVLGNIINLYYDQIEAFVEQYSSWGIVAAVLAGLIASFLLGSSSKFSGFVAIATAIFGPVYLPLFFAFDYMGYMFSPVHKCMVIGREYFGTPWRKYWAALGILTGSIAAVSILLVLFQTT
jgi:hypothetical protein